jgi:hypothetical protein
LRDAAGLEIEDLGGPVMELIDAVGPAGQL